MITGNFREVYFRIILDKIYPKDNPIRIIGDPDNQRADKWSSIVYLYQFLCFNNTWRLLLLFFGGGAYQHCSHEGLLYSNPLMEFRHSSQAALHTKRRERPLLAKDGTKTKEFS
jgi:hypothetical protein